MCPTSWMVWTGASVTVTSGWGWRSMGRSWLTGGGGSAGWGASGSDARASVPAVASASKDCEVVTCAGAVEPRSVAAIRAIRAGKGGVRRDRIRGSPKSLRY
jgi:hypothetical protein